jgi:hypothetical protein
VIPLFTGNASLLLAALLATLPVLIGIQAVAAIAGGVRRRRQVATPHGAAVRGLIRALNIHPLTISFAIDVTARDIPTLTVFRELSEGEVESIAEWIRDGRIQTVEQIYRLELGQ